MAMGERLVAIEILKKMNKLFTLFFFGIFLIGLGGAIECNAGGVVTEDCTVTNSMVLDGGTYYLNDTNQNGVIRISGQDLILDGNGTTLIGNSTSNSRGIDRESLFRKNITIFNFTLVNFDRGVFMLNASNSTIYNMNISNGVNGIRLDDSGYNNISNNILNLFTSDAIYLNDGGLYTPLGSRNIIKNNNISNVITLSKSGILVSSTQGYDIIDGNNVYNCSLGITTSSSNNNNISSNFFDGTNGTLVDNRGIKNYWSNNTIIYNNVINNSDIGITYEGGYNGSITWNSISNATLNNDWYSTGMRIALANNILIENNKVNGGTSIMVRSSDGVIINNNNLSLSQISAIGEGDSYEVQSCVAVVELWKGFRGAEGGITGDPPSKNVNITKTKGYASNNVTVTNNNCEENVFVRFQGTTNYSHDFTNYWYRSLEFLNITDRDEFFVNNDFKNISGIDNSHSIILELRKRYYNINYNFFYINKNSMYFGNMNGSYSNQTNIYNQTNSLLYNTNGSIFGSSNINSNDGNINITLPAGNSSYVLDNYNLTQGITRENDPLFNGTYVNNTLVEAITVDTHNINIIKNGVITSGSVISDDSFTISPTSYFHTA